MCRGLCCRCRHLCCPRRQPAMCQQPANPLPCDVVPQTCSYRVRMAVIDLDNSPSWWKRTPTDNLTASEARRLAGTAGPVRLLTHPPAAGYSQNPISVYYCYSADGSSLEQCIAEVTNTPGAERVSFLFRQAGQGRAGLRWEGQCSAASRPVHHAALHMLLVLPQNFLMCTSPPTALLAGPAARCFPRRCMCHH